jgi:hypothetical protein
MHLLKLPLQLKAGRREGGIENEISTNLLGNKDKLQSSSSVNTNVC